MYKQKHPISDYISIKFSTVFRSDEEITTIGGNSGKIVLKYTDLSEAI